MPRHVAFLRAINVGGHTVTMADLRRHFEALGLARVETFIASGNVVFEARGGSAEALRRRIERHLGAALGWEVATFLRSPAEVAAVARHAPFDPAAMAAARALNVAFLEAPLGAAARRALAALETPIDRFHAHGREVYWLCRVRQSESRFSNAGLERALGVRSTMRGMNTVQRLAARLADGG